ncbi:MAG: N,N-dimethylformamidase beta subunit family domain-containing protein, partial [Pseudomonadota bacterium]
MTPLAAYADRLSVRPGETVRFHGAGAAGVLPHAAIHRVVCADPNPAIGSVQTTDTGAPLTAHQLSPQRVPLGSFAEVGGAVGRLAQLEAFTVLMRVKCTRLPSGAHVSAILSSAEAGNGGGGASLVVHVTSEGVLSINGRDSSVRLPFGDWSLIAVSVDRGAKEVALSAGLIDGPRVTVFVTTDNVAFHPTAPLRFASEGHAATTPAFNGLIERPMIFDRVLTADDIVGVDRAATARDDGLVACWDFARDMSSDRIVDIGPHALHGTLINTPTRAVRGSRWTGREMAWRHAPDEYAAIRFHDDDIDDCAWPVVASFTVPEDFVSGQYALMLDAEGAKENVPFWVVPPKGRPTAKIAVLVSTFTYCVYGNHARPEWSMDPEWQQAWRDQTSAWNAYPHNPGDHADLGLSTYNTHTDGAGISIASWHRPMLNLRLGFLTYPYADIRASGLRHYPTDTHLTMWLEAKSFDYDIITDWELHHEGRDLLDAYQVVLTGTHPEYHTREMLDALQGYRDGGGRFCYFGGNGFYWKIALSPTRDGVVEIRRAEGGIRAWAAEPGEYYNQFDGAYGGLWRRNGRPPQHLTGVGFSA